MASFWDHVDQAGDCWEWQMSRTVRGGYGQTYHNGKVTRAHRVAWELTYGAIPDGMLVLHHCDNPPCVRPEHLYLGTHRENNRDTVARQRYRSALLQRTHCKRGHPFAGDNVYHNGRQRMCRTCKREDARNYRARKHREEH